MLCSTTPARRPGARHVVDRSRTELAKRLFDHLDGHAQVDQFLDVGFGQKNRHAQTISLVQCRVAEKSPAAGPGVHPHPPKRSESNLSRCLRSGHSS